MLRFADLKSQERMPISRQDEFNRQGTNYLLGPFLDDFARILGDAVRKKKKNQVAHIQDEDKRNRAHYNLPLCVYGLEDENIAVYMLLHGITGDKDAVVLQLKKAPYSHVTAQGESLKASLNEGIVDFVLPGVDLKKEAEEIADAWSQFSSRYINKSSLDERSSTIKRLASIMTQHDPIEFIVKYLYPIQYGFWDSKTMYANELRERLPENNPSLSTNDPTFHPLPSL